MDETRRCDHSNGNYLRTAGLSFEAVSYSVSCQEEVGPCLFLSLPFIGDDEGLEVSSLGPKSIADSVNSETLHFMEELLR